MDITRNDLEFIETQKLLDLLWKIIEDLHPKRMDDEWNYSVHYRLLDSIEDDILSIDMKIARLKRFIDIDTWELIPLNKAEKIFSELDNTNKVETIAF